MSKIYKGTFRKVLKQVLVNVMNLHTRTFLRIIAFCPQICEELRDHLILKNKKPQFHSKIKVLKEEFDKTIIGFL